jgi:hypothetical protein
MKVACPKCAHEFEPVSVVVTPIPEFRELLTPEAKKIYDTPLRATVFETFECVECQTEFLKTKEHHERATTMDLSQFCGGEAAHVAHVLPEHEGHTMLMHARLVQFLAGPVEITLAQAMVGPQYNPDLLELLIAKRLRVMAHIFNRGVAEGWIAFGVLMGAVRLRLAAMDPRERVLVACYPGIKSPSRGPDPFDERAWLNEKIGFETFCHEGELGFVDPWDAYAKANNIE